MKTLTIKAVINAILLSLIVYVVTKPIRASIDKKLFGSKKG